MVFIRSPQNPIITPRDVKPSRPDFEVIGTFNAGVAQYGSETILLVRVAERPQRPDTGWTAYPYMTIEGDLLVKTVHQHNGRYNLSDPRMIVDLQTGETSLTSISHIRLARSLDGVNFAVDEHPWLTASPPYETFGVEDARVTPIDGTFYINYSAVSPLGISTGLVMTRDFVSFERGGIIFSPSNRDVTLFPRRVDGQYVCYHRPMPSPFGSLNIWLARSSDLKQWGEHQLVLEVKGKGWESGRVGGGAPPIYTDQGWLSIYHAADSNHRYCLGTFLTPLDAPERIIKRSPQPVLWPEAPYETEGFFANVVFTCGALLVDGVLRVYYGAADEVIALAEAPIGSIMDAMDFH
jgi:beta-1,2-mannobiose phosphorylase / 1,2-beta-oligomannan phosphorylase